MKSCGVGNIWHWDERYVEFKNLYSMYKPICSLVSDVDFGKENLKSFDVSNEKVNAFILRGKSIILGYIRNKEYDWKNVLRDNKDVDPDDTFTLNDVNVGSVSCFRVWDKDKTTSEISDDKVVFRNIQIGTLFKIN